MFVPGNCMEIRVESDRALPQQTEKPTPLLTARRNTSVPALIVNQSGLIIRPSAGL